jgi:hypothetical protein
MIINAQTMAKSNLLIQGMKIDLPLDQPSKRKQ